MNRHSGSIRAALIVAGLFAAGVVPAEQTLTQEEMKTAVTLHEAHEAMSGLRALPGGCPVAGRGVVELTSIFEAAEQSIPQGSTVDGWGRPILAWCDGRLWATISTGADGLPAGSYETLPEVSDTGDDFVLIDDQRFHAPEHVLRMAQMGKQKRTMADIRSVALVFESYRVDNDALPGAPTDGFLPVETIREIVQPVYIRELPLLDGWGNPIWIWTDGESYRIVSAGRDGIVEQDWSVTPGGEATGALDSDIVFGDGVFRQWPEGTQS